MAPTQTKTYWGTPEQQHQEFLVDAALAAEHGWVPRSFEQVPGSMHVTYDQVEPEVPEPASGLAVPATPEPAAGSAAPAAPPGTARPPKLSRRDIWAPVLFGVLLGGLMLATWAVWLLIEDERGLTGVDGGRTLARCQPASAALVTAIEDGLAVPGGGGLRDVYTITSQDHQGSYFVAARISGIGMQGTVGLWATSDLDGGATIYSVNSKANALSVWPDGRGVDAGYSQLDDGAEVVTACADG